jgi:hypothetical protein
MIGVHRRTGSESNGLLTSLGKAQRRTRERLGLAESVAPASLRRGGLTAVQSPDYHFLLGHYEFLPSILLLPVDVNSALAAGPR